VKIYLDVSCLNRPFDDQTQPRIRLESEAVTMILDRIEAGQWEHVSSEMALVEVAAMPDGVRRRRVFQLLPSRIMGVSDAALQRAAEFIQTGLGAADAVHVASAEALGADVLLTCDDRLLRQCRAMKDPLSVHVDNPKTWLEDHDHAANT
jgi:predicted nucleic acid-binding protein